MGALNDDRQRTVGLVPAGEWDAASANGCRFSFAIGPNTIPEMRSAQVNVGSASKLERISPGQGTVADRNVWLSAILPGVIVL